MEQGARVAAQGVAHRPERAPWRLDDRTGLAPWVATFLRDASESMLDEMWALGTDHVGGYRGDASADMARRLVAAIERELRRRASDSLILPENIERVLARDERSWRAAISSRSAPSAP